jgi:hypothetical protein
MRVCPTDARLDTARGWKARLYGSWVTVEAEEAEETPTGVKGGVSNICKVADPGVPTIYRERGAMVAVM